MKTRTFVGVLQLAAALSAATMAVVSYGCGGGSDSGDVGTTRSGGAPSASISSSANAPAPDASTASGPVLPADAREVTFPASMTDWGWMDVTTGGAAIGCPDALPGAQDPASIAQTTAAIQCRLNGLGIGSNPGALFFPAGTYFIDRALSLTQSHYVTADGGTSLVAWGDGDRSEWTSQVHISGADPATTKIVWAGSCDPDPDVADPAHVTKYNDIFYIDGVTPLILERLTLDGQSCAGDGIDMVSKPGNMSGVSINEMTIENLKEVGIVGDRPNLTKDEVAEGDTTGMVSEVTITNVSFAHIGYAAVMPDAANAVDWWIRDSSFDDCAIGVTNSNDGNGIYPGMPQATPLPWGNGGIGGFEIDSCVFTNSRIADIIGGTSVRNSFSLASKGPFLEVSNAFFAQGNTVVAAKGVMPVVTWGGTSGLNVDQIVLLQNEIITADDDPAVLMWTKTWGLVYPLNSYQGASAAAGDLWNETYSNLASIDNRYTSTKPFSTATGADAANDTAELTDRPGWAPDAGAMLQCGPLGGTATSVDGRSYCAFAGPDLQPVYNLLTYDDQLGVARTSPTPPSSPPVRPIVNRSYLLPVLTEANTPAGAAANATALQSAIDTLAANQASCAADDYLCPDRWSIVFIPSGTFYVSTPIEIPGAVQLQIVGTGESNLAWLAVTSTGGDASDTDAGALPSTPVLRLHAPAHVAIRDLALFGEPDIHSPDPQGEGLVAEVSDLPTSRVFSDAVRLWDGLTVDGIGDAIFDMRALGTGAPVTITGNGATGGSNAGFFAFFGGNPTDVTVGGGANLMIQDSWYEGGQSGFVGCASGDSANITVETSNITPGGWHGVFATPQTTFDLGGCTTRTAIIASNLSRDGWTTLAPSASLVLPATATASTQLLSLANTSINSTYGGSEDDLPASFTGSLDQGYLSVDPASKARYADVLGAFFQTLADTASKSDRADLAARASGDLQADFLRAMLAQAMDARQMSPARLLPPITDMASTDIRIEHVWAAGTKNNLDMQFVRPGAGAR